MGKELSWKPVRRGDVYCSPACGAGCKLADYQRCVRLAKALAKRMGPGWKPYVGENLHWYYGVYKGKSANHSRGFFEITPPYRRTDTYMAWIQSTPQFTVSHKDPKIALREAVKLFDAHIENLQRLRALVDPLL
jgi:hypothetical protein